MVNVLRNTLFLTCIFFFLHGPTYAATLTVCASGCQYTSIQSAVTATVAGDTVVVNSGTYSGFILNKKITVTAASFNANDPRQNTVLINGQVSTSGGSSWAWDQGPILRGFRISGSDPVVMNNSPLTLEYNDITGSGGDNVSFEGGGGIVRGNRIQNPGDDCIDIDNQSKNILIENNYITGAHEEGIEMRHQPVSMSERTDIVIRGNRIEGAPSDGFQIMDYNNFSNRRYIIERNLFIGNRKGAIAIMGGDVTVETLEGAAMPEPMYVVNNTFVGNYAGIAGGANAAVINNIFSGQTGFDLKNVNTNSVIKYNLFAAAPRLQGTNNLDSATTLTGNPLLTTNYTLSAGSPAIDRGIAQYQYSYQYNGSGGGLARTFTDYVVNMSAGQYSGTAPDLGMAEFGGVNSTPTPTQTPPTPTATAGKPGDANGDGRVDGVDYVIWLNHYNQNVSGAANGDFNNSGRVDGVDYVIWLNNYGQ